MIIAKKTRIRNEREAGKQSGGKTAIDFSGDILYHPLMCSDQKLSCLKRWKTLAASITVVLAGLIWLGIELTEAMRDDILTVAPPVVKQFEEPVIPSVPGPTVLRVEKGDTFESLLIRAGLERRETLLVIQQIRPIFNPRQMQIGQTISFLRERQGAFRLEYKIDPLKLLVAEQQNTESLMVRVEKKEVVSRLHVIRGRISYSLFDAISALGERDDLADRMAALFEYDVDFNRDLRRDDRFAILVEKLYAQGQFIAYGRIYAATLINAGREISIGWHSLADQSDGYFHPSGEAVEKFFLRCPLPFMRLTSSFGNRRHPVLGFSAQHNGIDLGAPIGTPVRSTASGRIRRVGRDSVKGVFLEATHPNGYETHYYHLSRLASNIRTGTSVSQGQLIAYVGNSGRSTGAHLHYGIRKAGRFINPLSLKTPPKRRLPQTELQGFQNRLGLSSLLLSLGDSVLQRGLDAQKFLLWFTPWLATASDQVQAENR